MWVRMAINRVFMIFPDLRASVVVDLLANGRLIEFGYVVDAFIWIALFRGGILACLAWFIYRRRELATFSPNA